MIIKSDDREVGKLHKMYERFSFFLHRNDPVGSSYIWKKYFCWFPVIVESYHIKSVVWFSTLYRRGPFIVVKDNGSSTPNAIIGGVFEYTLHSSVLNETVRCDRLGDKEAVVNALISDNVEAKIHREQESKDVEYSERMIKSLLKKVERYHADHEREATKMASLSAPEPFEENSGINKE